MTEKIIAVILILVCVLSVASCSKVSYKPKAESTADIETTEYTREPETTIPEEVTEPVSGPETESATFAETVSSLVETTSRIISTMSPDLTHEVTLHSTTAAPSTTRPATTKTTTRATTKPTTTKAPKISSVYEGRTTPHISAGEFTGKKYGMTITRNEDETFKRTGFWYASYSDMLPAAAGNVNYYRDFIYRVLEITNSYRAALGIAPLTLDRKLCEQASVRAEEVAWSGYWPSGAYTLSNIATLGLVGGTHARPNGQEYNTIFEDNGYTGHKGENLCKNKTTPEEACEAWKNSSAHYKNMTDATFTKMGVGVSEDPIPVEDGGLGIIVVQHFYE